MAAPVAFLSGFKVGFVATDGRLHVESLETASRNVQTLNFWRNVSNFYAWQFVSSTNEQQSQNLLLKVDPLSTIRNNKFTRGGGGYSKTFYTGRLRPEVQPLILLYTVNNTKKA